MAITWVAFLLRTIDLDGQSLWRDEVDAIRFSSWPFYDLVQGLFKVGHNGPLFFLVLRPWRTLTGDSEFALRYPSALWGTLVIPLSFVAARQLGLGRRVGLVLGLLMATSPYLVWYGQEAKMYALLVALVTVAFIAYLKALKGAKAPPPFTKRGVWWAVFVIATSLSYYTHILSPLMLLVYGTIAWLYRVQVAQQVRNWLISMACLTLPYVPLAIWQVPLLITGFQSGHPFYSFQEQTFLLLQLYSSGLIQFGGLIAIILFIFLFLCGLLLKLRPKKLDKQMQTLGRYAVQSLGKASLVKMGAGKQQPPVNNNITATQRLVLAAWVFLPPFTVYLISLRVQIFEDRYLIYITPAFYLIIVMGLVIVRQYARWLASLCLGLILTINLLGVWQQRRPVKADFRGVAEHLSNQSILPSSIMIQMPYLQHTLKYYYKGDYNLLEGLWTNNNKSEATVNTEMTALTADLKELWLIVSEEDLWDNRHLTRAWLDENSTLVDEIHYTRVSIYYYQFNSGEVEMQSVDPVNKKSQERTP